MNDVEVLILHGSPGSGKSTLADAIAEQLREAETTHAVIDLDEFARIYTAEDSSVLWLNNYKWKNLAAVWPNYSTIEGIKIIIPVVIDTAEDLKSIRLAAPAKAFTVCELTAPLEVLKQRVTQREPNDYWQQRLRGLVENYSKRHENERFADIRIATHEQSARETAAMIIKKLGWDS
jgi:adenylylsulfate kinase-like enzyme